jgi:hypothetical protein
MRSVVMSCSLPWILHFVQNDTLAWWASVSAPTLIVDVEIDDHPVQDDKPV